MSRREREREALMLNNEEQGSGARRRRRTQSGIISWTRSGAGRRLPAAGLFWERIKDGSRQKNTFADSLMVERLMIPARNSAKA